MTVEEGNKIIAKFDGWESLAKYSHLPNKLYKTVDGKEVGIHLSELNYHSDWNLLMTVVEKIEDVKTIGQRVYVTISPFSVDVYCSGVLDKKLPVLSYKEDGKKFNDEEKRLAVWRCVIKTIQWYNSQTPQQ